MYYTLVYPRYTLGEERNILNLVALPLTQTRSEWRVTGSRKWIEIDGRTGSALQFFWMPWHLLELNNPK